MIIDAHHHLWNYDPVEYGWISEKMDVIRRSFAGDDLDAVMHSNGVGGTIAVQARQTIAETEWLLDIADRHERILGVVGWIPLANADVEHTLAMLSSRQKLRGVRHVVQDEPDEKFILGEAFNRGVDLLRGLNLAYDILIYERHLPQAIRFVDMHPQQVFVLDHIAKPRIADGELSPWRERIVELGRRPNVFCKVSGMVTEADWGAWTSDSLRPYWDVVLEAFGPKRIMYGSDWPVVLLASTYERWMETVGSFVGELSPVEQRQIWSETARAAYRL